MVSPNFFAPVFMHHETQLSSPSRRRFFAKAWNFVAVSRLCLMMASQRSSGERRRVVTRALSKRRGTSGCSELSRKFSSSSESGFLPQRRRQERDGEQQGKQGKSKLLRWTQITIAFTHPSKKGSEPDSRESSNKRMHTSSWLWRRQWKPT